MPEFFKCWLESLTDEQAEIVWNYLDGYIGGDEIEVIAKSHPELCKRLTGRYPDEQSRAHASDCPVWVDEPCTCETAKGAK